jgi:hypothetical protein
MYLPSAQLALSLGLHEEPRINIVVGVGAYGANKPCPCVTGIVIVRREGQAIDKRASAGLAVGITNAPPLWIELLDNASRQYFEHILSK